MIFKRLYSLQYKSTSNFDENLSKLESLINRCQVDSIIVAPEVSLTGFYYEDMQKAHEFSQYAKTKLLQLSTKKLITITLIEKKDNGYYNILNVFYNNKIVHTQSKVKLFTIGDETKEFKSGDIEEISIFEVGGVRFGAFICFELRFIDIWDRLRGADIIMIPAMWGKPRKQHFEALTNSLAIINQCYVVASDSANDDMASSSSITSPFGDSNIDDSLEIIQMDFDNKEIKKMRRYLDVGLI